MRKDFGMKLVVLIVLLAVGAAAYFVILPNLPSSTIDLRLGDGLFRARVANNDTTRAKGLSGTTSMSPNQAMLMAFPSEGKWGIWMKDMNIPIDIVWLNSAKKVIYIVKNATPEDTTLTTYAPKYDALYVIELPAGTVDSKAITIETTADFQVNTADIK